LEMQLWTGTTIHSHHHFTSHLQRERRLAVAVHHSHFKGDNMNIIKTILKHIEDKPLWAVVILIIVMYVLA